MKKYNILTHITVLLSVVFSLSSCVDYLSKDPDSIVSAEEAFKNFKNYQGFVEELYNAVPDKLKGSFNSTHNWGDDEILKAGANDQFTTRVDNGNYWGWNTNSVYLWKDDDKPNEANNKKHGLWSGGWYAIRKANLGLANYELLKDATQEERNLILGQLYFFRAWYHFEMSMYWGGLPYITEVLDPMDIPRYPRLEYAELIDLAAEDFIKAAELLPVNWDETTAGAVTAGRNQLRINKVTALAYLGKAYLYAASPLINHGAMLNAGEKTYEYNLDYAAKAAEAFGEILALVEGGETQFKLSEFSYSDIYDHTAQPAGLINNFTENIYTVQNNFKLPGGSELIFTCPAGSDASSYNSAWSHGFFYGPKIAGLVPHDAMIHMPTANYVENYGMDNGLPLDHPDSGFDPNYPFKNRDPRFYHDIVFDGFEYVNQAIEVNPDPSLDESYLKYLNLSNGGWTMDDLLGSRTGYFHQKLAPHQINKFDNWGMDWNNGFNANLPYMRLADIYLMYAEALAATDGGANAKSTNCTLSAVDAINAIRESRNMALVHSDFIADNHLFMDEVRRERAVELAFEGHRFNDLRRWLLLTEKEYADKTVHRFDRVESDDWYKNPDNDIRDARVANFRSEVVISRQYDTKHYWLPFLRSDCQISTEFKQNPGW